MNSAKSITLGIFILAGIGIFAAGLYYLGRQRNLFGVNIHLTSVFKNVNGLQVGNNVRFSGINVGTVDEIDIITDTSVLVTMIIDASVQKFIKVDAAAIIGNEGLMGNKVINIISGTQGGETIADNAKIRTVVPIDVDGILLSVKHTAEHAERISGDLEHITHSISSGHGMLGKIMFDKQFASNLDATLFNVRNSSGHLDDVIVSSKDLIEATKHSMFFRRYFRNKDKDAAEEKDPDEVTADSLDNLKSVKKTDAKKKRLAEKERKKVAAAEKELEEKQAKIAKEQKKELDNLTKQKEEVAKRKAKLLELEK